jgi:hypothetical protein
MPNDAKLGLLTGLAVVVLIALLFRKEGAIETPAIAAPPPAIAPAPASPPVALPDLPPPPPSVPDLPPPSIDSTLPPPIPTIPDPPK